MSRLTRALSAAGQPVTPFAVYKWLGGTHVPRLDRAVEISRLSDGRVSLADIYGQRDVVKPDE